MSTTALIVLVITIASDAANTVNISTGSLEPPSTCLSRLDTSTRSSSSVASTATRLLPDAVEVDVANSIGEAVFTAFACSRPPPLQYTAVTWQSVVPAGWTSPMDYTSNSTWAQPWYYPPSNTGRFAAPFNTDDDLYHEVVRNCLLTCVSRYPASLSLILFLAYGSCYCSTALPSVLNVSTDCCAPLVNSTPTSISDVPGKPPACDVGVMYGQLLRVNLACPINASSCATATTPSGTSSCAVVSGCCTSKSADSSADGALASAESTAAKWLVGLLLVAVACQMAYWVIKLRMCGGREDRPNRPVEELGDAAILRHNAQRRTRRVARIGGHDVVIDNDEEMEDGGDMLAQLNEIARRMRIAFIRQQQQRAEPKRSKDEALDAALEALQLFPHCPPETLDPEESCCMCLDPLSDRDCVRVLCGHIIHRECMRDFLAHKLVSYRAPVTCPMCRATVLIQNSAPSDSVVTASALSDAPQAAEGIMLAAGGEGTPTALDTPLLAQANDQPPRQRRRSHSRGRRFRVVMANLAVGHILERRHDGDSDRSGSFGSTSLPQLVATEVAATLHQEPQQPPPEDASAATVAVQPFTLHDL
jgi:hypothetical protein